MYFVVKCVDSLWFSIISLTDDHGSNNNINIGTKHIPAIAKGVLIFVLSGQKKVTEGLSTQIRG